jgi:hypothetical protein
MTGSICCSDGCFMGISDEAAGGRQYHIFSSQFFEPFLDCGCRLDLLL